jgi:hypothetical protein
MSSPADGGAARPRRAPVGAAALAVALAFMAHGTYLTLRYHYTIPNLDDWRLLEGFFSRPLLAWLVEGQAGHRMPTTLALIALDYHLLDGHMHLPVAVSVGCTWLAFAVAWVVLRSHLGQVTWGAVLAFTGATLFWAGGCYDLVWAPNQGSQQATLLVFAALAALAFYQDRLRDGGRPGPGLPAVAALAAVGATFSQGIGAATFGALVAVALIARVPWRVTVAFTLTALAAVAVYRLGLETGYRDPTGTYWMEFTRLPWRLLWFVASFVGIAPNLAVAAIVNAPPSNLVGFGCGAVGLVGFAAYAAWLVPRRTQMSRPEVVALGLMTFVTAGGVIVGLNRLMWGMIGIERWVTWSAIFWIGAAWALGDLAAGRARGGPLLAAALAGTMVCAYPALRAARGQQQWRRETLRREAQMLLLDIRSDGAVIDSYLKARPERIYRVTDRLRENGWSFFADPDAALPGAALSERFARVPAGRCRGVVYRVDRLATRGDPAVELRGYAWDKVAEAPPALVVVTDARGRICGLGTFLRQWPPRPLDGRWRSGAGWSGFVPNPQATERYIVHAVLADGHTACPLVALSGAALLGAVVRPPA